MGNIQGRLIGSGDPERRHITYIIHNYSSPKWQKWTGSSSQGEFYLIMDRTNRL
jgi:hypothetical protein